jgi:hypothetical protein
VDAAIHEAHFDELFWDGFDWGGVCAEARDDKGAALE